MSASSNHRDIIATDNCLAINRHAVTNRGRSLRGQLPPIASHGFPRPVPRIPGCNECRDNQQNADHSTEPGVSLSSTDPRWPTSMPRYVRRVRRNVTVRVPPPPPRNMLHARQRRATDSRTTAAPSRLPRLPKPVKNSSATDDDTTSTKSQIRSSVESDTGEQDPGNGEGQVPRFTSDFDRLKDDVDSPCWRGSFRRDPTMLVVGHVSDPVGGGILWTVFEPESRRPGNDTIHPAATGDGITGDGITGDGISGKNPRRRSGFFRARFRAMTTSIGREKSFQISGPGYDSRFLDIVRNGLPSRLHQDTEDYAGVDHSSSAPSGRLVCSSLLSAERNDANDKCLRWLQNSAEESGTFRSRGLKPDRSVGGMVVAKRSMAKVNIKTR